MKFICKICWETLPIDQCFKSATFRACFNSFCKRCIAEYIQVEISNHTRSIKCPFKAACNNHILNPISSKELISEAVFNRWCDNLCELAIRGLERCYCPNKACMELIVDECSGVNDNVNRKIDCPSCKNSCCFGCSSPWEDRHLCPRGRNFLPPGKNWQRCPGCKFYVEKRNWGCSVIHCRCGTAFCYYCGSRYAGLGAGCRCTTEKLEQTFVSFILTTSILSISVYVVVLMWCFILG